MYIDKVELDLLVETSWEVCNKVGGIYTVLSTKAKNLQRLYKDKVIFIGPDVWSAENPSPDFKESKTLLKSWLKDPELPHGVSVRVGRWTVPGRPIAVLVKFDGMYAVKDAFYGEMWKRYGVDSLHAYGDYDEACAFGHAAGVVIESLVRHLKPGRAIAHFDEWTTGMGLLYTKAAVPSMATVFTTHATSTGRSICGNGKDLYKYFKYYNGDQMARELNMEAKHSLEKAAAHQADCFTTVSDITADECEQLLDRRPDVVTPNGFEENFVPGARTYAAKRQAARRRLFDTVRSLTGTTLDDDTFVVVTSGRCEYRNKGLDMFLDSMTILGSQDLSAKVLAIVAVPAWVRDPRPDLVHNMALGAAGPLPRPLSTHRVHNPDSDAVLTRLETLQFANNASSRVLCIYMPCYLDGRDGVLDIPYYDLLPGVDATVFASYYEPWGYTPLESVAFGVPTVTTTLSGFGRWVLSAAGDDPRANGVWVLDRNDDNYGRCCRDIAVTLKQMAGESPSQRRALQQAARTTAAMASWDYFIDYYVKAFDTALKNAARRN